ncbi:acyl-ACP thioesterase domain-containing protein [Streptococcus dentiloxodontae]
MGKTFKMTYQVPFYETDVNHNVKLSTLLSVALQVSSKQSEELGNADDYVYKTYNLVWVITDYDITIDRLPVYNEIVTIETEAVAYNKLFCYRDFYIYGEKGDKIMTIGSTFVLMDYDTRKVAEVPDDLVAPYESDKIKKILRGPKYKLLENAEHTFYHVRYFDLDMNGHVNNSKYLEWMLDVFELDFLTNYIPKKIHLKYVKEIHHGNDIHSAYQLDGLTSQHQITVDDSLHAQAIIDWQEKKETVK